TDGDMRIRHDAAAGRASTHRQLNELTTGGDHGPDRRSHVSVGAKRQTACSPRAVPSAAQENPAAPPAFHLLAKPSGSTCNIDCTYCFFLSKEALYPNEKSRMSSKTLETYIRQLLESHRAPTVIVAWQGGEPTLMGLDFFRRSVEL